MRRRGWWIAGAVLVALAVTLPVATAAFPEFVFERARAVQRWQAGLTEHSVQAAAHEMPYLAGGHGDPLLLLHGFGSNKDTWDRVARHLTPHFRVIAPDLPGFGDSVGDPALNYGYAEQVERLRAFLARIGISEPVHLAGNSMGGGIAGLFAARYPQQVRSLWLIAPVGARSAEPSELIKLLMQGRNPMLIDEPEDFARLLAFVMETPPYIPGSIVRYLGRRAAARRDFNAKVFGDMRGAAFSLEQELQGSDIPTLILWGAQDRLLHVSGAHILGALIPNAQVVVLDHVGHVPMFEVPKKSAERYLAFQRRATAAY